MSEIIDEHTLSHLTVSELQFLLQTLQREIAALPEGSSSRFAAFANAQRVRNALARKRFSHFSI
jgi:hypothetical protein